MSNFLENYESANDTIIRFRKEHPTGRIVTHVQDCDLAAGWILIRAEVYREYEDSVPSAVDIAYGNVATLPQNMKKWFCEDCSTSAIARAIKLLSPTTARPSREDMARVEFESTPSQVSDDLWATLTVKQTEIETGTQALGSVLTLVKEELEATPPQTPHCRHGFMDEKKGIGKTGKPYQGYVCPSKERSDQCKPVWL
jgi:RNase P subunit RPR2